MLASAVALAATFTSLGQGPFRIGDHYWPTPNPAFLRGEPPETYLQPTASGELQSALFGCVRNDGLRFHEGIDLKPISRDRRGEATDPIFSFDAGVVRYVNERSGTSGYGRYVVIEHPQIAPGLVTLYSHLRSIDDAVVPGAMVKGGQRLGIMGRSAGGYSIPRDRAHLHFEVAYWLGPYFQQWFDRQRFDSQNHHESYNGMNIVGMDVWQLLQDLRSGTVRNVAEFLASEPAAVEAFVRSASVPEMVRYDSSLMANPILPHGHVGWRVEVTWYGMPVRFEALTEAEMAGSRWLEVRLLRPDLLENRPCFELASPARGGTHGPRMQSLMQRLFLE